MSVICGVFRRVMPTFSRPLALWTQVPPLQWQRNFLSSGKDRSEKHLYVSTTPRAWKRVKAQISLRCTRKLNTSCGHFSRQEDDKVTLPKTLTALQPEGNSKENLELDLPDTRTPRKGLRWSPVDQACLAQMRTEGYSYPAIGDVLGRSTASVSQRARDSGLATPQRPFTKDEDERILAAGAADARFRELQKQMPHRKVQTLQNRYRVLISGDAELSLRRTGPPEPFSLSEDACIIKLRGEGMGWAEILKHLPGPNRSNVQRRYHTLVAKEDRVEVRNKRWWSEEDKEKLQTLLDAGHTVNEIASTLGKSPGSVKGQVERLKTTAKTGKPIGPTFWTPREVERLLELDASGKYTRVEVAVMLNKSINSVVGKLSRLGVARKGGKNRQPPS